MLLDTLKFLRGEGPGLQAQACDCDDYFLSHWEAYKERNRKYKARSHRLRSVCSSYSSRLAKKMPAAYRHFHVVRALQQKGLVPHSKFQDPDLDLRSVIGDLRPCGSFANLDPSACQHCTDVQSVLKHRFPTRRARCLRPKKQNKKEIALRHESWQAIGQLTCSLPHRWRDGRSMRAQETEVVGQRLPNHVSCWNHCWSMLKSLEISKLVVKGTWWSRLRAAGVSFSQCDLDQIFGWLEELDEMPILFSDEKLGTTSLAVGHPKPR